MPPMNPIKAICADRDLDAFTKLLVIKYTAPERTRPDETTNTKATMIVAGCPKPENAEPVGTTPTITPIISAEKATISYRNRPHNRHKKTAPKRAKRMICCSVMWATLIIMLEFLERNSHLIKRNLERGIPIFGVYVKKVSLINLEIELFKRPALARQA